jgi:hypothetical protein
MTAHLEVEEEEEAEEKEEEVPHVDGEVVDEDRREGRPDTHCAFTFRFGARCLLVYHCTS